MIKLNTNKFTAVNTVHLHPQDQHKWTRNKGIKREPKRVRKMVTCIDLKQSM